MGTVLICLLNSITGQYFSETFILASYNPQHEDRLVLPGLVHESCNLTTYSERAQNML